MSLTRARWMPLFLCTAAVTVLSAQSSPVNRPWPPAVQNVSSESPPLSPADALKTFYMPPGYRVELVAAEPLVQDPIAIDWDVQGRLWVVEMPGFMADITGSNEHDPLGRVVVLEDTDGDGRMDKRTVFSDHLVLARSVKVLERGVLVAEPPNLWLMRDTNGDLRADVKEIVSNRFGRRDGDPQNQGNGFVWGLDNWLHTAGETDLEFRLQGGRFEIGKTLERGEWGISEDDAGRIYRNTNESALHVDLVPTAYYARNPDLLRTRGSYERLADGNADLNTVWPVRPNPGTNRAYQTGIDRPDGTLARYTSVCAPLVYRGDRLPAELYGNVFVAEPAANLVSRLIVEGTTDGGVRARKAYERGEFLASTDERFRPVYISNAPDGTLYIVDLYHGIIEHRISITMYLRDQILARTLDRPTGLGRIYRVMHDTTVRDTSSVATTPAALIGMLTHPNVWRRETAQRLLVEGHHTSAVPALMNVTIARDWRARLRALWTLDGLDAIEPPLVLTALKDEASAVRVAAVRLAERWLASGERAITDAVRERAADQDAAVRRQFAASVGAMPTGTRESAIAALLEQYGDDPITMDAALSSVHGTEGDVLQRIGRNAEATPEREAAIAMLAATIVRSADETAAQDLLASVGDRARAAWVRAATLRGTEIALLGAAMPGARRAAPPPPVVANLPCPTCPGGRAGPGGAYAFQRPGDPTIVSAASRRGPSLRLKREPAPFTALAASTDDLAARAKTVLTHVTWPGKRGEASVTPLTAAEARRFDEGREIYKNICQACHQADGRGQDQLAPSLVASRLALASPEIAARILLNGKEGSVGLMPPIGSALNDDQIAAVLTYVRREWGNDGSPVDAALIKRMRALTAARTRPWTDGELNALPAAGRGGRP
ncbi:MAG TPA: PVC-type heme-binding CxxCH protein [Vicinamibacterales bacterium]|nr:PVC-type heme-binding CxxCH protein [Vicinamibacterales bacterium]